jgi:hypothetical protein
MARPQTVLWPAISHNSIALLQTLAGPGLVNLNGYYGNQPGGIAVISDVLSRAISITSVNNLTGVNFTIVGSYLGQPVNEVLAGPNNTTVQSVNLYDQITSITASGAAAAFSVGTGIVGYVKAFTYDFHANNANLSVQVEVAGAVDFTFFASLVDTFTVDNFSPIAAMIGSAVDQFGSINFPIKYCTVRNNAGTGSLSVTYLQQGLTS